MGQAISIVQDALDLVTCPAACTCALERLTGDDDTASILSGDFSVHSKLSMRSGGRSRVIAASVNTPRGEDEETAFSIDYEEELPPPPFLRDMHVRYLATNLFGVLPSQVQCFDLNRMVFAYFASSGLDILGMPMTEKADVLIESVYALQVLPTRNPVANARRGGFRPSPYAGSCPFPDVAGCSSLNECDVAHVTMTQAALLLLLIAGDDLSRVDREATMHHISDCQTSSGCFTNVRLGSEQDVRFVYSACVVCEVLQDWSGFNVDKAVEFLASCQRYDGGFGESPHAEGHGGTTYCAVASLALMRRLDVINIPKLLQWIVHRQERGFNGRPNKLQDTCYSYWLGCTLAILGLLEAVDTLTLTHFILGCQNEMRGGISKNPTCGPDLLHTFLSLAALGLFGHPGITKIDPALGVSLSKAKPYYVSRAEILKKQVAAQLPTELLPDPHSFYA